MNENLNIELTANVVHGNGHGKTMGFPTINLDVLKSNDVQNLEHGVYAVFAYFDGKKYMGAMNYGMRPTFNISSVQMEVFLIDFDKNIYGEQIKVTIIKKIRNTLKFSDQNQLIDQITKDVETAKKILLLCL